MRFISETLIRLYCWAREETAQTMTEYGVILSMASIAAVALLLFLGPQIAAMSARVTDILRGA
jgi:Flp pilus assembly pilin Flp